LGADGHRIEHETRTLFFHGNGLFLFVVYDGVGKQKGRKAHNLRTVIVKIAFLVFIREQDKTPKLVFDKDRCGKDRGHAECFYNRGCDGIRHPAHGAVNHPGVGEKLFPCGRVFGIGDIEKGAVRRCGTAGVPVPAIYLRHMKAVRLIGVAPYGNDVDVQHVHDHTDAFVHRFGKVLSALRKEHGGCLVQHPGHFLAPLQRFYHILHALGRFRTDDGVGNHIGGGFYQLDGVFVKETVVFEILEKNAAPIFPFLEDRGDKNGFYAEGIEKGFFVIAHIASFLVDMLVVAHFF
jgi:hypothetical protein